MKKKSIIPVVVVWVLAWGFMTSACSVLKPIEGGSSKRAASKADRGPEPAYRDFSDILIPGELKPIRPSSSVFQTEALSGGVLSLVGKTDTESLIQFFKTNMAKDNWKIVSGFRAGRSLLLFEKQNRWCMITVTRERYGTHTRVEIWVSPKTGGLKWGS